MKTFILVLLVALIFLSGCTIPNPFDNSNLEPAKPLTITLSSDLTTVKSEDMTYLYLTFDNLDEKEEYYVSAKIMNSGLFSISSSPDKETLSGFQRKTVEWELKAPKVPTETHTQVSIETTISKTFKFTFPILFADSDYLRQYEVSKRPKTYSFSDNLVNVVIELNKNPPIDTGTVYANIKVTPKGTGMLDSLSISVDGVSCETDEYQDSAFCTFSAEPKTLEEKNFEISVNYDYKATMSSGFIILPEGGEFIPSPSDDLEFSSDFCLLEGAANYCTIGFDPIKWCRGDETNCISSLESASIKGIDADASLRGKDIIIIGNIKNSGTGTVTINYRIQDKDHEGNIVEKDETTQLQVKIIKCGSKKGEISKHNYAELTDEQIFTDKGTFKINSATKDWLTVMCTCGNYKTLGIPLNNKRTEGGVTLWYVKPSSSYRLEYYADGEFIEKIAGSPNPSELVGTTYTSTRCALEIVSATKDKITVKLLASSGGSGTTHVGRNGVPKSCCGYKLVYAEEGGRYKLVVCDT